MLSIGNLRLKLESSGNEKEPWVIICYMTGDYSGDSFVSRSTNGFILYILGIPLSWQPMSQRSMTLSSSKAEWVALSECVQEIIFVIQLLRSMKVLLNLPIIVRFDNAGAIFMTSNITTMSHIKHMDKRYKYVIKYVEDRKIIFIKSAEMTVIFLQ